MNTDIDKGMFLAESLKTLLLPEVFTPHYLQNKIWKKTTGYSRKLLAQHVTNSILRILTAQGKPDVCMTHTVRSKE